MSGQGSKKATRDLARRGAAAKKAEAQASKPGSVVVKFTRPCHAVPWWRGARDEDHTQVFSNSAAGSQGDVVVVQTTTPAGPIQRFLNWRDVDSVVVVPSIPGPAPDPKE